MSALDCSFLPDSEALAIGSCRVSQMKSVWSKGSFKHERQLQIHIVFNGDRKAVRVCVRACVLECVRACVCGWERERANVLSVDFSSKHWHIHKRTTTRTLSHAKNTVYTVCIDMSSISVYASDVSIQRSEQAFTHDALFQWSSWYILFFERSSMATNHCTYSGVQVNRKSLVEVVLCFVQRTDDTKSLWGFTFCLPLFLLLLLFAVHFLLSHSVSIYLIVHLVICSKWLKMISFSLSVSLCPFLFAPLWLLTFQQQKNNKRVSTEFERSGRFEGSRWGVRDCGNPYFLSWLIIFVCCGHFFRLAHCMRDRSVC